MPRSSWAIVAKHYKQIRTITMKGAISALLQFGLKEHTGEKPWEKGHFVVNRRPPSYWVRPFESPIDFDNYISTCTGTGFQMVSLASENRGLNVDGILADESLTLNKEVFDKGIKKANRGNLAKLDGIWKGAWFHHGVFHFSSMPYGESKWLLEAGNYYDFDFRALRRQIAKLQLQLIDSRDVLERIDLFKKIAVLKKSLRWHKSKAGLYYSEADVFDNLENVGMQYIEDERATTADFIFLVEVLNYFPETIEDGFYPLLDRDFHGYKSQFNESYIAGLSDDDPQLQHPDSRMDGDCLPNEPLRIAVDWGSKINSMVTGQHYRSINMLRYLKNHYVKSPNILDDLAHEWCRYYRYHGNKDVYFAYDVAGNTQMANSNLTYAEQFARILEKHGFNVIFLSRQGINIGHSEKYLLWAKTCKENDPNYPTVRFNLDNCNETMVSMSNAPAKETNKGLIEKVKTSERNAFIPQEEATHLSDAADILLCSVVSLQGMDPSFTDNIS
ncbi:MAG: hypothetical protein AAGF85_00670 [Bacteroidota bacterium]